MKCRHCHNSLQHTFLDLGFAPPSNAYRNAEDLNKPELYYPLILNVCERCWLVQTEDYVCADELFTGTYAYFSSVSQSWCEHACRFSEMITNQLSLDSKSLVIEIGSNDGYLLKHFVNKGIRCIGIEPTSSTAEAAENIGIPVLKRFFGSQLAQELATQNEQADLIIGNNVYAHVPDINDFTKGLRTALKPGGTITLEFPHLLRLIEQVQFDTVYHEHYSYLSLFTVNEIFVSHGLRIFNAEELSTHGGSLRIYGCHSEDIRPSEMIVSNLLDKEERRGLRELSTYTRFQGMADEIKNNLLTLLIEQKRQGKKVAAYGAAAKGNTLINYAGIKPDLIPYVCDAAESKQGKFLPGSHIPILPPTALHEHRPDIILILPWNIADEIIDNNKLVRNWGGEFVVGVPKIRIL